MPIQMGAGIGEGCNNKVFESDQVSNENRVVSAVVAIEMERRYRAHEGVVSFLSNFYQRIALFSERYWLAFTWLQGCKQHYSFAVHGVPGTPLEGGGPPRSIGLWFRPLRRIPGSSLAACRPPASRAGGPRRGPPPAGRCSSFRRRRRTPAPRRCGAPAGRGSGADC